MDKQMGEEVLKRLEAIERKIDMHLDPSRRFGVEEKARAMAEALKTKSGVEQAKRLAGGRK